MVDTHGGILHFDIILTGPAEWRENEPFTLQSTQAFCIPQASTKRAGIDLTQKKSFQKDLGKKKLFRQLCFDANLLVSKAELTKNFFCLNTTTFAICFFWNTGAKLWFISSSLASSICVYIFKHLRCSTVHIIHEFCLLLHLIHLLQFEIVQLLTIWKWNRF